MPERTGARERTEQFRAESDSNPDFNDASAVFHGLRTVKSHPTNELEPFWVHIYLGSANSNLRGFHVFFLSL